MPVQKKSGKLSNAPRIYIYIYIFIYIYIYICICVCVCVTQSHLTHSNVGIYIYIYIYIQSISQHLKNEEPGKSKIKNNKQCFNVLNKTCLNNNLLPKYTRFNIYIYIYIYIYICMQNIVWLYWMFLLMCKIYSGYILTYIFEIVYYIEY